MQSNKINQIRPLNQLIIKTHFSSGFLTYFIFLQAYKQSSLRNRYYFSMFKPKDHSTQQSPHFQPLPGDSPQIRPESPVQQPEDLDLADQKEIQQIADRKNRRKKLKAKKTNLIRIKPVQSQQKSSQFDIQYLTETGESISAQINETSHNEAEEKPAKGANKEEKKQKMDSPVLYRISDDQELEQRQQDIPQSSRRPLKSTLKPIDTIFPSQKRSDSDEPESPVKLINRQRKSRPKQQTGAQHTRRFVKMKKQVELIEKRQPTQVYQYEDCDSSQQNQAQSQDESPSDEKISEGQDNQHESQKQKSQQKKQQSKPEITVFKSNSFYTLINAEIPKGNFVNCLIRRKRTDEYFQKTVTYELFLLQDKKYLMTCTKNRLFKTTSHFQFYREKPNAIKYHHDNLYAYMDSNFTGTEFVLKTIHKNDTNSERSTAIDKSEQKMEDSTSVISDHLHKGPTFYSGQPKQGASENLKTLDEKEVLFILFKANFFGFAGQRQVSMLKKKNKKVKNTSNFSDLRTAQENGEIDKFTEINSKKAIEGKNGLELDFKGIAKVQSTKNIILQGQGGKEALVFGKLKEDIYSVAIGSPLSIVEGLAFGIANLDRKFFVN